MIYYSAFPCLVTILTCNTCIWGYFALANHSVSRHTQIFRGLRVSLRFVHSFLCLWNKDLCQYQKLDPMLQRPRTTWWVTQQISKVRATTLDVWPGFFPPEEFWKSEGCYCPPLLVEELHIFKKACQNTSLWERHKHKIPRPCKVLWCNISKPRLRI